MFVLLHDDGTPCGGPFKTGEDACKFAIEALADPENNTLPMYAEPARLLLTLSDDLSPEGLEVWLPRAKKLIQEVDWAIFELTVWLGGPNDEDPANLYSWFERR